MAGAGPVDMNQLTPGIEYTFILNDGNRIYGMLETYLGNNGIPRRAVRLANGYQRNGIRQQGTTNISLDLVNRVVQDYAFQRPPMEGRNSFPQPIIQPQPAYVEGMRPSERFMKHGWLAQGERRIDAIHNPNPLGVFNTDAYIQARNINRNTNPPSNYYSPEEIANMRAQITENVECPICLEPINDDRCRVCMNGHKFHLTHPGQIGNIVSCPVCRVPPPFYRCDGNYNDTRSGGKKQKGNRKNQENPVENHHDVENRPDVGNIKKIELN